MNTPTESFDKELHQNLSMLSSAIAAKYVTSLAGYQKRRNEDDETVEQIATAIKQAVDKYVKPRDFVDIPTMWEIVKATKPEHHHEKCSYRQQGMLCDCALFAGAQWLQEKISREADASLWGDK